MILAQLPRWWFSTPPAVNLVILLVGWVGAVRCAWRCWTTEVLGYRAFGYHYAAVAIFTTLWVAGLTARVVGVLTLAEYVQFVGPLTAPVFLLLWVLPQYMAMNRLRHREQEHAAAFEEMAGEIVQLTARVAGLTEAVELAEGDGA